jgi:hypothetical protein
VRRPTWAGLGLALCLAAGASTQEVSVVPAQPRQLAERLERAWQAKDAAAYLGLWTFKDAAARDEEAAFIAERFRAEESTIEVFAPGSSAGDKAEVHARAFTVNEPRGRLEQWLLQAQRGPSGWTFTEREPASRGSCTWRSTRSRTGRRASPSAWRTSSCACCTARSS